MADVKLLESQRLTDNDDGGGLMTSVEVVDGQVNNLFPDISRIDRVNGRVNMRKTFMMATTANDDLFLGLHMIVLYPPQDPRVSGIIFTTESWTDVRIEAQDYIEGYLAEGPASRMYVYDTQLEGQRSFSVLLRPDLPLPEIGNVYVLDDTTSGTRQFVRIATLDHEVQTFTDEAGDFQLRVITLGTTQPLLHTFPGDQPTRFSDPSPTLVRKTTVADRARYYGVTPLAQDADSGDLTLRVESIFGQLVPSTQGESAVTNSPAGGGAQAITPSATVPDVVNPGAVPAGGFITYYLPLAVARGSLSIAHHDHTATDDGEGNLLYGTTVVGLVDYATGKISDIPDNEFWDPGATATFTYLPAGVLEKATQTFQLPVTISTRGYIYQTNLRPVPAPGTLVVSYRAYGRWYEMRDDGAGVLSGDTGVGVGTVNYATGAVVVTLGALPDIGSSVMFTWGAVSETAIRAGDTDIQPPAVNYTVAAGNIEPGTLELNWLAGAVAKTATDNGSGVITGDATGKVIYGTGLISMRPTVLPDPNTVFSIEYEAGTLEQETFNPSLAGSTITINAASAPIRPRSVFIQYQLAAGAASITVQMVDNGSGQLIDTNGNTVPSSNVNYTTGAITFDPDYNMLGYRPVVTYEQLTQNLPSREEDIDVGHFVSLAHPTNWATSVSGAGAWVFVNGQSVLLWYKQDGAVDDPITEEADAPPIRFDVTPLVSDTLVPGSLMFTFSGRTYVERAGSLYSNISPITNSGTLSGSVDLVSGQVTLTQWTGGGTTTAVVKSLLTQLADLPLGAVTFRTPGSPIRPGSLFITAVRASDSDVITATADVNGNIDTAEMHGYVDSEMGIVSVAFGAYVLDSSLTADDKLEPWYDSDNVDGDGYIWRPAEVIPGSVLFSTVIQTFLPLDPDLLGLDPTRLPLDGRVPIFRAGDTLVIHDTQVTTLSDPLSANDVETLPRDSLAEIRVFDADGVEVPTAKYAIDLEAGTITMADPLDLTGYTEPLVARHRQEDMALCTDAQITGQISLAQALTHDYTAANSLVSSALIAGDVQARYSNMFEQNTWTNVWQDTLIGAAPTSGAQYNDATYPLAMLNRDAITQRWRLQFTSSTVFNIVGETLGIVGTGNTSTDVAPINPGTGQPYFQLDKDGFGTGWATGNLIRFNTVGAGSPVWVVRTIRSGPPAVLDDAFAVLSRWDKE